jgi:hypothetical protein
MRTLLRGWNFETANDADEWGRDIFRRRLGRELWRPLLFALLLVLVIETLTAATGGVKKAG